MPYFSRKYDSWEPDKGDIYVHVDHGKGRFTGNWHGAGNGHRKFGFSFEDGYVDNYYLGWLTLLYDARIRKRDLVDIRREDGIVLRGTVVDIDATKDKPYLVNGRSGESVWMAAHEFERFVKADAPEKAYESLKEVRARIEVLEAELRALKITEEVLEGIYT